MIEVKNISFAYGTRKILDRVSFTLQPGESLAILGNNGVGKSTLITCLNKIRRPAEGELLIRGRDVLKMSRAETARHIAYVAQKSELGRATVFDTVLLGRKPHMRWTFSQHDLDLCDAMLDSMGMGALKLRFINELSGGEVQKVMLARALVQEPELLLLDEPTSNLDPKNRHEMMSLIRELARSRGFAAMTVIHDLNLAARYCDRFLFLKDGHVFACGGSECLNRENIRAVYDIDCEVTSFGGFPVIVACPDPAALAAATAAAGAC